MFKQVFAKFAVGLLFLTFAAFFPDAASAGDWPQWRYDANRSGTTDEEGPSKGRLLWSRDLGRPDPAFDHQYRMCADATYTPVAAEGLLVIPSNTSDQVRAYDLPAHFSN